MPSRRSFGEFATAKKKKEIATGDVKDPPIAALTAKETGEIGLTVVIVHGHLDTAGVPSPTRTKRTDVKLLLSERRTTVSRAWLKLCCLTVGIPTRTENVMFATVIVNVIGRVTVTGNVTGSGIGSESEIGKGIETGTEAEIITQGLAVMTLPAITIAKGVTGRKNERGFTADASRDLRWMSSLMEMTVLPRPDDAEMMTKITIAGMGPEIQR